jgi:hypothetical protein
MKVLFANLAWFLSTLPDALRFAWALRDPVRAQARVARRRKPTRPEDILLEEPTSGTTAGTKWIPYTEQLRCEFMRAVNPWMASIYLRHPGLLLCTHYWSVSPYTEVRQPAEGPRRGFSEDRDYLGGVRGFLTRALFPVTAALAGERDPERHRLKTARALVASRRLGLISVWHPSAFLRLLDFAAERASDVTGDPRLAAALRERRYGTVWPRLRLISCWDAAFARADADRVRWLFPSVEVEGKGLLATEGVVSFPWFGTRVAAVTSHTLGFERLDEAGEPIAGTTVGVGALTMGGRYGVILSTGNGFTGYRLGDVVACTGFVGRTPRLEFLNRAGGTVDLHGEKLHPSFAAEVLSALSEAYGTPRFATLAPAEDLAGYILHWEVADGRLPAAADVERRLGANYYYAHAVNLGQLRPVRVELVTDGLDRWCRTCGVAASSAKVLPLLRVSLVQ